MARRARADNDAPEDARVRGFLSKNKWKRCNTNAPGNRLRVKSANSPRCALASTGPGTISYKDILIKKIVKLKNKLENSRHTIRVGQLAQHDQQDNRQWEREKHEMQERFTERMTQETEKFHNAYDDAMREIRKLEEDVKILNAHIRRGGAPPALNEELERRMRTINEMNQEIVRNQNRSEEMVEELQKRDNIIKNLKNDLAQCGIELNRFVKKNTLRPRSNLLKKKK